jgi:hypothetical protein
VLRLLNLEEIEALLLKVPALVKRLEERDPEFVLAVKLWLGSAEDVLGKNGMSQTAEVAVCRSGLITAERGFAEDGAAQTKIGARAFKEVRASQLLARATEVVAEAIRPRRVQIEEAGRIMLQVVAVADQLGLVLAEAGASHTAYLQAVLLAISSRTELAPLVVHITGLVGKADALIVLDRSIAGLKG